MMYALIAIGVVFLYLLIGVIVARVFLMVTNWWDREEDMHLVLVILWPLVVALSLLVLIFVGPIKKFWYYTEKFFQNKKKGKSK